MKYVIGLNSAASPPPGAMDDLDDRLQLFNVPEDIKIALAGDEIVCSFEPLPTVVLGASPEQIQASRLQRVRELVRAVFEGTNNDPDWFSVCPV